MASNTATLGSLPSGVKVCTTFPDLLCFPEMLFGVLVWILVSCTLVMPENPQGWVMFVSVFCFVLTFIWSCVFCCGGHRNKSAWAAADFVYHFTATVFYLSASVTLAMVTQAVRTEAKYQVYQLDISAVVFSYVTTLLYFIHTILSAYRWKSF